MQINLNYDASVNNAPPAFQSAMAAAAQFLDNLISDPITVSVDVGWGEVAGQPVGPNDAYFSFSGVQQTSLSYAQLKAILVAHETSATDAEALDSLPTIDPTSGGKFIITPAQEKAWGMLPSNGSELDGSIGFNSTFNFNYNSSNPIPGETDFFGTAVRELTHVLGRDLGLQQAGPGLYRILDLFHYSAAGQLNLVAGSTSYFSINDGYTNFANFDTTYTGGDWSSSLLADAFSANGYYYKPFTSVDAIAMEVSGFKLITPNAIQNDYLAITQTTLSLDQATTEADAIIAGTTTETAYVNSLLSQVADTTIPVVAVEASMYGAVGSSAVITNLVTNFLPGQLAYAMQVGLDPQTFACLETALVFAFANESGSTAFANNFGPSNAAMPATAAGDAAFAAAATNAIFGSAQTANTAPAILGYVHFLEGFFTANGIVGVQNPTPDQIVIAARAGAWGEGIAIAESNNLGPFPEQTINFLEDAAQGTAIYSASLASQPTAAPFQGAATASAATTASDVQVTGVAAPGDHAVM